MENQRGLCYYFLHESSYYDDNYIAVANSSTIQSFLLLTQPLSSMVILKHAKARDTSTTPTIDIDGLARYGFGRIDIMIPFGSLYYKLHHV